MAIAFHIEPVDHATGGTFYNREEGMLLFLGSFNYHRHTYVVT